VYALRRAADAREDGVQYAGKGESPANLLDPLLAAGKELQDDLAEQTEIDESPDEESVAGRSNVGDLCRGTAGRAR
jgi:hypothetical protein